MGFNLLHLSTALLLFMFVYILVMKSKKQIHHAFLFNIGLTLIWSFGNIFAIYYMRAHDEINMDFVNMWFIGLIFVPISLLFTGIIYKRTKVKFTWKYMLLLVIPVISCIILLTNPHHNLFFREFSLYNVGTVYGRYFIVHSAYSYVCILTGLFFLLHSSIKNSGFFTMQSALIALGIIIPLFINVLFTLNLVVLPTYATVIGFSFSSIFFMLAIIKFSFLNVIPIALQTIVDNISDCFLVINEDLRIIDYNNTFVVNFKPLFAISRKKNIMEILDSNKSVNIKIDGLVAVINKAREKREVVSFEKQIKTENFDKYFMVEITPIISNDTFLGTIILLKDITQSKKDLATIQRNHAILMEQERLASLGQLIGGIAHNLKTPIMSISGGLEAIRELATEYEDSIGDERVKPEDHREIAKEIKVWIEKIKPYCGYMSDIISAVKGQAVYLSDSTTNNFTLGELLKRVDILMRHELKRYHCKININSSVSMLTEFKGEANNLVQIFDNIIVNAIHSYGEKSGEIDLNIVEKNGNIEFAFRDYGSGISEQVQKKLFKEMLTTKGKFGTGLGLYMSYSTIKGRFNGDIWFESKLNKGSTFYISIPYVKTEKTIRTEDKK
ncbi:MAG: histidine kinase N-terminal 7TM domain-containing protein [Clostridia bacterium]